MKYDRSKKPATFDDTKARRIRWIAEKEARYADYWRPEIDRQIRNGRAWWGVNFGQWPAYVVERCRNEGRRPPTYNILFDKTETLVGSLLDNGYDVRYEPVRGVVNSLCFIAQDMQFADRNRMDWETSEIRAYLDMLIMVAYERMTISDKLDPMGNITWETVDPTHTYLCPEWMDDDPDHLEDYITWSMMTPGAIAKKYRRSSQKLRELQAREETDGVDYGEFLGAKPFDTTEDKWGSAHKVIEYHSVKLEERWSEYDLKNHCLAPDTGFDIGSDEDRFLKAEYFKKMGLTKNDIAWQLVKKRIKYIQTTCPTIDRELFLEDGKDIIQTNNVNLYPLGIRYKNQWMGMVDRLFDIQMSLNKGEMNIDDIQERSAHGAFLIDRIVTGGDANLEKQIEQMWNDPAFRAWASEGTLVNMPGKAIMELPQTTVSADLFRQQERRYDMTDRFSKVSAAQDSRTEGAGESGRLFQSKAAMALVGQKLYSTIIRAHKARKARAYVPQARVTYSGAPREFGGLPGKKRFTVNQRARDLSGRPVIVNPIANLPDMLVSMVPSKNGVSVRDEIRTRWGEMINLFGANQNMELLTAIGTEEILETFDNTDEKQEEIRAAAGLIKRRAALRVASEIMVLEQQVMGQQQMQQGMPQIRQIGAQPQQEEVPLAISYRQPSEEEINAGTPTQFEEVA